MYVDVTTLYKISNETRTRIFRLNNFYFTIPLKIIILLVENYKYDLLTHCYI
jgi:hypothetical protein